MEGTVSVQGHRPELGIAAGASAGRLEGRAKGLRDMSDFSGTYSAVLGGGAFVGGSAVCGSKTKRESFLNCEGPRSEWNLPPTWVVSSFAEIGAFSAESVRQATIPTMLVLCLSKAIAKRSPSPLERQTGFKSLSSLDGCSDLKVCRLS
jgi:hypothetical protein